MICVAYSNTSPDRQCVLAYPPGAVSSRIMGDNSVLLLGNLTTGRVVNEENDNVCERYDMIPILERGGLGVAERLRIVCRFPDRPLPAIGVPIRQGAEPEVTQIEAISMDALTSRIFERSRREYTNQ
jgi:hypothetical protein